MEEKIKERKKKEKKKDKEVLKIASEEERQLN